MVTERTYFLTIKLLLNYWSIFALYTACFIAQVSLQNFTLSFKSTIILEQGPRQKGSSKPSEKGSS